MLGSMLNPVGYILQVSIDGDDRMGVKNQSPKTFIGLLTKPKKIPESLSEPK